MVKTSSFALCLLSLVQCTVFAQWYDWTPITSPVGASISTVEISTDEEIYFGGFSIDGIYYSSDFGESWELRPLTDGVWEIQYLGPSVLGHKFRAHNNYDLFYTSYGWDETEGATIVTSYYPTSIYGETYWLTDLHYYAVKFDESIRSYGPDDPLAGTVIPAEPEIETNVNDIYFLGTQGWVVTEGGNIHGFNEAVESTWSLAYEGATELNAIKFQDENIGYAVGADGLILKTIDGGLNWYPQNSGTINTLTHIDIGRRNQVVACGDSGTVVSTVDGSHWIAEESLTVSHFRDIAFINDTLVMVVGSSGSIFLGNLLGVEDDHNIYDKRANTWSFGEGSGVQFSEDEGLTAVPMNEINSEVSASCISDSITGEIKYYTDGEYAWNNANVIVPGSEDLPGGSSCGIYFKTLMVDHPELEDETFLFHIGLAYNPHSEDSIIGLYYSIINDDLYGAGMSMDVLNDTVKYYEPFIDITAVNHANQRDVWILVHDRNNYNFYSFLIDCNGLNKTPVITEIGYVGHTFSNAFGTIQASPRGDKVALAWRNKYGSYLQLFDFNTVTGKYSNPLLIDSHEILGEAANTVYFYPEFSSNGSKMIVENDLGGFDDYLRHYDIDKVNYSEIIASMDTIGEVHFMEDFYRLQLAPDGRVYGLSGDRLSSISNPNQEPFLTEYTYRSSDSLHGVPGRQLPKANQSIFYTPEIRNSKMECGNTIVNFWLARQDYPVEIDSLIWDFGDPESGDNNISEVFSPIHNFSGTGFYDVSCKRFYNNGYSDFFTKSIYLSNIQFNFPDTIYIDTNVVLNPNINEMVDYQWSTMDSTKTIVVDENGTYILDVESCYCGSYSDSVVVLDLTPDTYNIVFPNVFTPDENTTNEVYFLTFLDPYYNDWELRIVNRWGIEVGRIDQNVPVWNGDNYENNPCPAGVYFYTFNTVIKGELKRESGTITIFR